MNERTEAKAEALRKAVEEVTKEFVDKGMLIEAGWLSLRMMSVPPDAPAIQLEEMRNAFFAGAQHVFSSIMSFLSEGEEPTATDLQRMDMIDRELKNFIIEFTRKHFPHTTRTQ